MPKPEQVGTPVTRHLLQYVNFRRKVFGSTWQDAEIFLFQDVKSSRSNYEILYIIHAGTLGKKVETFSEKHYEKSVEKFDELLNQPGWKRPVVVHSTYNQRAKDGEDAETTARNIEV